MTIPFKKKRLCVIGCHVLWRELCYYASLAPHVYQFHFLKQGLHNEPDVLRREVQDVVDRVEAEAYTAILLGYGLCSNGLVGVTARNTPLL